MKLKIAIPYFIISLLAFTACNNNNNTDLSSVTVSSQVSLETKDTSSDSPKSDTHNNTSANSSTPAAKESNTSKTTSSATNDDTDKINKTNKPAKTMVPDNSTTTKKVSDGDYFATNKASVTQSADSKNIKPSITKTPPATKADGTTSQKSSSAPAKLPTPKPTPKATVVIPTIKSVDAPGDVVYKNDNSTAKIDASNTSKGYVAVKYTGSKSKVKVIITHSDSSYTYNIGKNKYTYYPLQMGNGKYNISVYENVSGSSYMPVLQQDITVSIKNSDDVYLYPNQFVWFNQDSKVVNKSAQVCAGCESDFDKVSAIFKYVTDNISYDTSKASSVTSGYIPDISSILNSGKGICFDYASVFAAMCRAQGIPTKLAIGYVKQSNGMVYHSWNYVYTKEKGWITVSFYLNKTGYNLVDATFYSTISDKSDAADFINKNSHYQVYQYY